MSKNSYGESKVFSLWIWAQEILVRILGNAGNVGSTKTRVSFLWSQSKVKLKAKSNVTVLLLLLLLLFLGRLVLSPVRHPLRKPQEAKGLNIQWKTKKNVQLLLKLLEKWLNCKLRRFGMLFNFFFFFFFDFV